MRHQNVDAYGREIRILYLSFTFLLVEKWDEENDK